MPNPKAPGDAPPPRTIHKVRNPHGTRVARRITCSACGKSDTIDFAPKDPAAALCRRCAFERYGVLDPDDAAQRTLRTRCGVCRKFFEMIVDAKRGPDRGVATCNDCKAGVVTEQGDKAKTATRVSKKVVRVSKKPRE